MDDKFCVDCKHHRYFCSRISGDNHVCMRTQKSYQKRSNVTGIMETIITDAAKPCETERLTVVSGGCHEDAKYFEPKEVENKTTSNGLFSKLFNLWRK